MNSSCESRPDLAWLGYLAQAVFRYKLFEVCIIQLADTAPNQGCGSVVLDPKRHQRQSIGYEQSD